MRRRSVWLILFAAVLVVAVIYFERERLLRIAITYRIYHAHIFTPPTPSWSPANPDDKVRWRLRRSFRTL